MAMIIIPSLMRDLTGGESRVSVAGRTVAEIIDALDAAYPGVKVRLCDGDQLDPTIAVAVDGKIARLGLRAPVKDDSDIRFLPVVEGG
jgi:molybdopterin synthase sulfur carrier subunit